MATFGNTKASGLLRTAQSAANRSQAYNDAAEASIYDGSAKTQDDWNRYNTYLQKRIADTQNIDPTKALTLSNTARSANRSFTSAEIGRVSTSIKYGDNTLDDKYAQLSQLRDKAIANGDENLAQQLESQMASTDIARQNAVISAQNKARSDASAAEAATTKGYAHAISQTKDLINQLEAAKLHGEISPADYHDQMQQLYNGNPAKGTPGLINILKDAQQATGDPNLTYQSQLDSIAKDKTIQGVIGAPSQANTALGNNYTQVVTKDPNGTTYSFHDRPNSELATDAHGHQIGAQPLVDPNTHQVVKDPTTGQVIMVPQYAGAMGFKDKNGQVNGLQYVTRYDTKTGLPMPGTGNVGGALRQVDKRELSYNDPSGVPYFFNELGQKKFVGIDPTNGKPIMGNDPSVVNGKPDLSSDGLANPFSFWSNPKAISETWDSVKNSVGNEASAIKGVLSNPGQIFSNPGSALSRIINTGQQAQNAKDLAAAQAAAQARAQQQAAQAMAQQQAYLARQQQLLPVFRAPAPLRPPTPPSVPARYTAASLPAPAPLGNTGLMVPAKTGNNTADIVNTVNSLGNFLL